ncbi:hypothetical protein [Phormidium sp. CCY1219]|uniref:hypothetical protein n=1 Tax=Phormidium sp. CCY1219 TaxID=2886104 RepID=UPI002D1E9E0C|nr:hypothetical protein [Phormidium sp. CCY1219]MEB3827073.1 hypothetical protein [Phormidium sp. CCY1219]
MTVQLPDLLAIAVKLLLLFLPALQSGKAVYSLDVKYNSPLRVTFRSKGAQFTGWI